MRFMDCFSLQQKINMNPLIISYCERKRKGGNFFYGENKEYVSYISQRAENHFYHGSLCNACCPGLILNSVASINIGPYVKIGFSGIPNQIADYLFGPITGCLFAGVLDIVKFFIRPDGPFFFGFTFNAMLAAFIYGCFYYKHKLTFRRVLIAKLVVILVVNVLLNTLWLDMLYGKGFLAILPMRTVKNLIMWPVDSFIFFTVTRLIEQTGIFNLLRKPAAN